MTIDDIQRLGDILEPTSGKDLVKLFADEDQNRLFRTVFKRMGTEKFETVLVGEGSFTGTFTGPDGLVDGLGGMLAGCERFTSTITNVVPVGDSVVVLGTQSGATEDGTPIENDGAGIFSFFEGDLTRVELFADRQAALESVGAG